MSKNIPQRTAVMQSQREELVPKVPEAAPVNGSPSSTQCSAHPHAVAHGAKALRKLWDAQLSAS